MAIAYAHLQLTEGDFTNMGKLRVTHRSGNLGMLGFNINDTTDIAFFKESTKNGKRFSHDYRLTLKNEAIDQVLTIELAGKPTKGIVAGSNRVSTWDKKRLLLRSDSCTLEFAKNTIEVIFFKDEINYKNGKKTRVKLNSEGVPLKDDSAVIEAVKYLRLDATPIIKAAQ